MINTRVQALGEAQLLFVFETFFDNYPGISAVEKLSIKGYQVNYDGARALLSTLMQHEGDHQPLLQASLSEAEKLQGPTTVSMMDPVTGMVTITGMILVYNLAVKVVSRLLPEPDAALLKTAHHPSEAASRILSAYKAIDEKLHPDNDPVKVVIMTPKQVEFDAVYRRFNFAYEKRSPSNSIYCFANFEGLHQRYRIALIQSDSGLHQTATMASDALSYIKPQIIFLTGNAGRIASNLKIGDIVIGTVAYEFETGKELDDQFLARPKHTSQYSHLVIEQAKSLGRSASWKNSVNYGNLSPQTHFLDQAACYAGPIASSNKVLEGNDSQAVKRINHLYNDAIAVEMEAAGLLTAAQLYPSVLTGNIRSISDFKGEKSKTDQLGYKEIGAAHAAAFILGLLHEFPSLKLI